jgi:hypothetical protein
LRFTKSNKYVGTVEKILSITKEFLAGILGGQIIPLGEIPTGHTEMCEVSIFGQKYIFMS